ncbi:hypothetical protein PoB_007480900 [Plakobranchus ocellatus]|uniref:SERTA domain-containing protein n=1 Tax=Plakobranchus ocellatus TaxID=259542 RepID=A0AAV4DW28_9GAST|nr:hypothetical protein PoB_007480900 [Plakobranchus ocellatus]
MPPMATSSAKRKWSDVFEDGEPYNKQSLMDLCTSKLRYVNPARPPRRRTEVPLLRNVLIVNTMKHLSTDIRMEKPMEYNTEDLSVDPGHFEGLPPLSELLTDIMLDPQPSDQQHWTTSSTAYPNLTPLEPSISSYIDSPEVGSEEGKIVHDLLPCTSVVGIDSPQTLNWNVGNDISQESHLPWSIESTSEHSSHSWATSEHSSVLDCFLPSASTVQSSFTAIEAVGSESSFHASSGPLPSFTSLFESSQSSFTELLQANPDLPNHTSSYFSSSPTSFSSVQGTSTDDLVGNVNLTEAELELLAMTFSSKLPHMSFEDLVHALPQTSLLQPPQPSQTFYVPSSLQSNSVTNTNSDSTPKTNGQCASYCRKDQPQPNVDDAGMVRVLVNL